MTEERENLSSVMRRIAKLLAMAEDSRGDPNECAAAARMAERIMAKYQIEHVDEIRAELKAGQAESFKTAYVGGTLRTDEYAKAVAGWAGILCVPVAKLHECQARYSRTEDLGKCIAYRGYAPDADMCVQTHIFIVNNMIAASRLFASVNNPTRREAESFRRGYISGVMTSLKKMLWDKQAEAAKSSSSRDLAIVKTAAVDAHFGAVTYVTAKRTVTSSAGAFEFGRQHGSALDVGRRGVSGGSQNASMIGG